MSVQVLGLPGEIDGYADSMDEFRRAHDTNTTGILRVMLKLGKRDPLPVYNRADHDWPMMIYHPVKGELTIGRNLSGLQGKQRESIERENQELLKENLKIGYRREPYAKPQIAVLDPATEKMQLKRENDELRGHVVQMSDTLTRMQEAIERLQKGAA